MRHGPVHRFRQRPPLGDTSISDHAGISPCASYTLGRVGEHERRAMKTVILAAVSLLFAANLSAQEHAIETKQSTLTIHVGKTGMFSALGHEHEIRGAINSGSAETGAHPSVEVHVNARELKVI